MRLQIADLAEAIRALTESLSNEVNTECRWLPMDSAPKDGTEILGWSEGWLRHYVFWYDNVVGRWEWDKDDDVHVPSWWMPLPGPPGPRSLNVQEERV
jgi:hypothetical protein